MFVLFFLHQGWQAHTKFAESDPEGPAGRALKNPLKNLSGNPVRPHELYAPLKSPLNGTIETPALPNPNIETLIGWLSNYGPFSGP